MATKSTDQNPDDVVVEEDDARGTVETPTTFTDEDEPIDYVGTPRYRQAEGHRRQVDYEPPKYTV